MGDEKVVTEQRRNGADKRYAYQHWNALIAGGLTGTLPRQKCCAGQLDCRFAWDMVPVTVCYLHKVQLVGSSGSMNLSLLWLLKAERPINRGAGSTPARADKGTGEGYMPAACRRQPRLWSPRNLQTVPAEALDSVEDVFDLAREAREELV